MKKILTALLSIAFFTAVSASPTKSSLTPLPEKKKDTIKVKPASTIEAPRSIPGLKKKLKFSYQKAMEKGLAFPVLYFEAMSRLKEAERYQKADPDNDKLPLLLKSCSLYVEAANIQLKIQYNQNRISQMQGEKDSILSELNRTYQKINRLERGYASNLKKDLEDERRKALERQEDAREKFSTLQSDFIKVKKDARGIILSMSDILFDIGKASLTAKLKTSLAKIAGILTIYKQANIIVEGHTDNTGSEELNQKLSEKRAENVMLFLVEQGIAQARLTSIGYGFTKPVADNTSPEGRQKNRRVDLIISEPKPVKK